MNIELILDAKATIGEGPASDEKTQTLYWVDILEKRIYAGAELLAELDDFIGCLAPCKNGHLIVGKRASFVDFEPVTSQQTVLSALAESATNRMNDGKCDPAGRFIAGTMDMNETAHQAAAITISRTDSQREQECKADIGGTRTKLKNKTRTVILTIKISRSQSRYSLR